MSHLLFLSSIKLRWGLATWSYLKVLCLVFFCFFGGLLLTLTISDVRSITSTTYSYETGHILQNVKINVKFKYGIYIALYLDAQSALQHFVGNFARLLI